MGVTSAGMLPWNMPITGERGFVDATQAPAHRATRARVYAGTPPRYTAAGEHAMKQLIAISAIGSDRTGLVYDLTRVVVDCGGNILESRMTALGNEFATLMLVGGNWHTLAKLEGELAKLAESSGLSITTRRTEERPPRTDMVSYSVDVVCLDQPGILHALAGFFSSRASTSATSARAATAPRTPVRRCSPCTWWCTCPPGSTSRRCAKNSSTSATR